MPSSTFESQHILGLFESWRIFLVAWPDRFKVSYVLIAASGLTIFWVEP